MAAAVAIRVQPRACVYVCVCASRMPKTCTGCQLKWVRDNCLRACAELKASVDDAQSPARCA